MYLSLVLMLLALKIPLMPFVFFVPFMSTSHNHHILIRPPKGVTSIPVSVRPVTPIMEILFVAGGLQVGLLHVVDASSVTPCSRSLASSLALSRYTVPDSWIFRMMSCAGTPALDISIICPTFTAGGLFSDDV
jgi:hypothetical protein